MTQDGKFEEPPLPNADMKETSTQEELMPNGPEEKTRTQVGPEETQTQADKPITASDEEFFLLMKVGPCRKQFAAWQACEIVAKATGNENSRKKCVMDKCEQKVELLQQCVQANIDYHVALLQYKDGVDEQAAMEAGHDKNPLSTVEAPIDENLQWRNDEDREEHFLSTALASIDENTQTTSKAGRDNDPLRPSSIWFVAPVVILGFAYGLSKGWF